MHRGKLVPVAMIAAALLIAGCGSSSSSTKAAASSPATTTAAASSPSTSASTAPPVMISAKHSKLGTILAAGSKKMTVYLFEADNGPSSACSGACAAAWPPVIGTPKAVGGAKASDLGTVMRADGKTQVTYKGHPLYTFVKDKDDGDAYGEGSKAFGAGWYVLAPSGNKIDNS